MRASMAELAVAGCACAVAGIAHESAAATTRQSDRWNRMRWVMAATYPKISDDLKTAARMAACNPDERSDIQVRAALAALGPTPVCNTRTPPSW